MALGARGSYSKEKKVIDHDKGDGWIYVVILGLCLYFGL